MVHACLLRLRHSRGCRRLTARAAAPRCRSHVTPTLPFTTCPPRKHSSSRLSCLPVGFGYEDRVRRRHFGSGEAETTADVHMAAGMDGVFSAAVDGTLGPGDARLAGMLVSLLPIGEAATGLNRRASPTVNGLRRSGQLALLPLARRLSVVPAERRGEGVRRGVAGPAGDLGEGQLAGPQVVAGEGHPPVC